MARPNEMDAARSKYRVGRTICLESSTKARSENVMNGGSDQVIECTKTIGIEDKKSSIAQHVANKLRSVHILTASPIRTTLAPKRNACSKRLPCRTSPC